MTDYDFLGKDVEKTIHLFKQQERIVIKGKEAFARAGATLWSLRINSECGSHGKWKNFLRANDISIDNYKNYKDVAYHIMCESGIVRKGNRPTVENCIETLTKIDEKCALMHNLIDQIDMRDIWRQKQPIKRKTGSLVDLEPQYARLMGEARNRGQFCYKWGLLEVVDSLNLLDRFGQESGALSDYIISSWLDEEEKKERRHVTMADMELEVDDVVT